jgi:hypothetical protein
MHASSTLFLTLLESAAFPASGGKSHQQPENRNCGNKSREPLPYDTGAKKVQLAETG